MQSTISFPASAAWNEAIRPAIESHTSADEFQAVLDSVASQLTNPNISPDLLTFPAFAAASGTNKNKSSSNDTNIVNNNINNSNNNNQNQEKQQLINIGCRIILECILAGFVPESHSNSAEAIKNLLMAKKGSVASSSASSTSSSSSSFTSSNGGGDPLQSEEHAAAVAAVWTRYGRKIVAAQRTRAIDEVCQRTLAAADNRKDDDANVLRYLSAEVRICSHTAPAETTSSNKIKDDLFEPFANFAIAPENCDQQRQQHQEATRGITACTEGGVLLQLSATQTYNFLLEIDAIQRKLDELRG